VGCLPLIDQLPAKGSAGKGDPTHRCQTPTRVVSGPVEALVGSLGMTGLTVPFAGQKVSQKVSRRPQKRRRPPPRRPHKSLPCKHLREAGATGSEPATSWSRKSWQIRQKALIFQGFCDFTPQIGSLQAVSWCCSSSAAGAEWGGSRGKKAFGSPGLRRRPERDATRAIFRGGRRAQKRAKWGEPPSHGKGRR
jgi:hypothetical protein